MEPESRGNCVVARRGGKEAAGRMLGPRNTNHIRPQYLGESARDDEAPYLSGRCLGKCGGREEKVMGLTRGGLSLCSKELCDRQRSEKERQKSAEAIVAARTAAKGQTRGAIRLTAFDARRRCSHED